MREGTRLAFSVEGLSLVPTLRTGRVRLAVSAWRRALETERVAIAAGLAPSRGSSSFALVRSRSGTCPVQAGPHDERGYASGLLRRGLELSAHAAHGTRAASCERVTARTRDRASSHRRGARTVSREQQFRSGAVPLGHLSPKDGAARWERVRVWPFPSRAWG